MNRFPGVDFMHFDSLLTEEERLVRDTVRAFVDERLKPIIEECHRDGRTPTELVPTMAALNLFEEDYAWVTEQLKQIADDSAQGRIVSMLEGGYSLSALARSVVCHLRVLADF